jgi:hypothetical protein
MVTLHMLHALWLTTLAATSPHAVHSPFGGNGHNVSFDGRLFVVAHSNGWEAALLRPQDVTVTNSFPDVTQGAFTSFVNLGASGHNENALAMCEETPQPTACNQDGSPNGGGAYACYREVVIDSDALASKPNNVLRRRVLQVVVRNPGTSSADIDSFNWLDNSLTPLATTLRGIEPSITKDGKLLVWQGLPSNTGDIDTIVYSYNPTPCAVSGWAAPRSITSAYQDANLVGTYRIADRQLRGADGSAYAPTDVLRGAYIWIFPSGEAMNFTAVNMPCRVPAPNEDPPGCGPRRNALSVIGYPTNWQLAHIDGEVNPDVDQTVRLFFTSPGPMNVRPQLPMTGGTDVWPFFGSNTSNYTELVFDDGLDGHYGALWHLNELVDNTGNFDRTRVADSSGYSNTGAVKGGASFPNANNGYLGKAIRLDGQSGRVEIPNSLSLNPVNAITLEAWINPAAPADCDANNNYRLLISKGNLGGAYAIVYEENGDLHARVKVQGGAIYDLVANAIAPPNVWSHIAFEYDAATGTAVWLLNDVEVKRSMNPPAPLAGSTDIVTIGSPGVRAACPNGDGAFFGDVDEVGISNVWRYGTPPSSGAGGGTGAGGGSGAGGGTAATGGGSGTGGGTAATGGGSGTGGGAGAAGGGSGSTGGGSAATGGGTGTGGGTMAAGGGAGTGGGMMSGSGGGTTSASGGGGTAMSGTGGGTHSGSGGGGGDITAQGGCSSVASLLPLASLLLLRRRRRHAS